MICSVRVDRHLETISPSLKAGKDVYVEWPLGKSLSEAEQLLKLKNEAGVKKAVVGLQARQAPIVKKVKQLVDSGKIGKVLSSTWAGYAGNGGESTPQAVEYIGRREVGGNLVTIHFGHAVDYLQQGILLSLLCLIFVRPFCLKSQIIADHFQVLGYGFEPAPKTLLAIRRKTVKLLDADGKVLEENHPKTADDTIFLNGFLSSASHCP